MTVAGGVPTPQGAGAAAADQIAAPGEAMTADEAGETEAPGAAGTLVVGYGNALRGDDGVGPCVADLLAEDPRLRGATVLLRHQLTPELAADVSEARLVVLVDASSAQVPGTIAIRRVDAASGTGSASSHRMEPADVLALARELWGASAPMFAVTVGVASMGLGEGLSPAVERALPAVVDAVVGVVAEHGPI